MESAPKITYASNDWLGKSPFFYNTKTNRIANVIDDVIDFNNFDWDWAGLTDYLDFGYVVFGNTPIKNVKFLQANQSINITNDGVNISLNKTNSFSSTPSSPDEIEHLTIEYLKGHINTNDKILLPFSGGFDSRYLGSILKDNFSNHIEAFTFGTTVKQRECNEVTFAKKACENLEIPHNQIEINNSFKHISNWNKLFGVSTHLHGLHQYTFYQEISEKHGEFDSLVSGLVGDAWAGKFSISKIKRPTDLQKLGLTHGLNANSFFLNQQSFTHQEEFYESNNTRLNDPSERLIECIRMKMMLLRYLENVPESLGVNVISPFSDENIARRMMSLPAKLKNDRKWQVDYFKSKGLYIEEQIKPTSKRNQLLKILHAKQHKPFLKPELLKEVYNEDRVNFINKHIGNGLLSKLEIYLSIPFRGRSLILPFLPKNDVLEIIHEYMTLLPLQLLIEKRNKLLKEKL